MTITHLRNKHTTDQLNRLLMGFFATVAQSWDDIPDNVIKKIKQDAKGHNGTAGVVDLDWHIEQMIEEYKKK